MPYGKAISASRKSAAAVRPSRRPHLCIAHVNNDLLNLLSSIAIAVIMIGSDLTIRRFTPKARKFLGLIAGDVARIMLKLDLHSTAALVRYAIRTHIVEA